MFTVSPDLKYLKLALAYFQTLDFQEPENGYPTRHEVTLEWEGKARLIYHAALLYRVCLDMGFDHPKLEEFAQHARTALYSWTHWRPQSDQGFDRNNWANGYLPGAWALLGGDTETFHARGTHYIKQIPGSRHWVQRSTNHGIVILATYLTGAHALRQEPVGKELLHGVLQETLSDGCYPEGINYLGFILSELVPYLHVTWDGKGSLKEHILKSVPSLAGAGEMYRWSAGNHGRLRATFGDVAELKLYRNALHFADSLSDRGDLQHALRCENQRNDWRLAPLVAGLSGGGDSVLQEDEIFHNHVAVGRTKDWALWITGSRLHKTHNAAHDCGSFFFERDDLFVGEKPGREAWRHNVPLLRDAPDYPDCAGPTPFRKRWRHGSIRKIGSHAWEVIAPPAFDGCPSRIKGHFRHLYIVENCLVVLDRVFVEGEGEPVVQFHTDKLTSLWGHEVHDDRALCRMKKARRGWVSAAVIGASDRLRARSGLLFRGRVLSFPPERAGPVVA
ncbi:MAG: hypothetical protein MRY81_11810 [Donghicola eburneus]|nr:hypothetical protein [Donghicola eburneus]MCI5040354.1 hypothetical protein [Donghicola eburneus]